MAVIIKDMDMPKDCNRCEFWHVTHTGRVICKRTKLDIPCGAEHYGKRAVFCPLEEVSEE